MVWTNDNTNLLMKKVCLKNPFENDPGLFCISYIPGKLYSDNQMHAECNTYILLSVYWKHMCLMMSTSSSRSIYLKSEI